MFSKRGGKCKIVTCTRASLPNNYGFCALHGGSSSGVNANNHRSKGAFRRQELHDICKVKVCYRRALPGNYGFCGIHRKYVSRAERVRRGFKTAVVNTNKSSHIEAETTNILRAAVSLGDMPSESVLRKLEADPIVSINRTRADILGFYNSRNKLEAAKRIKVAVENLLGKGHYTFVDVKNTVESLLEDPVVRKNSTEKHIRKKFEHFGVHLEPEINSQKLRRSVYNPLPHERHLDQVQHLISLSINGHDPDSASNCICTYFKMLSSDLGRDSKLYTGGKVQLPYNVVKGAFEVAINSGDKNLIIQFLRLTLDNSDRTKCFYYSKVQIELLHYLYSIDLEQALSTAREFLISAQNLQLRRACANILLINLKRTKDSFVVNELRHEIVGVLRKTLSLHPSDTNALRALVLDDLGMRQNEIKSFAKAYMKSVDKAKLPTKGIELCIIALLYPNRDASRDQGISGESTFERLKHMHDTYVEDNSGIVSKRKMTKLEERMNDIIAYSKYLLRRDPLNLLCLNILEDYYLYVNSKKLDSIKQNYAISLTPLPEDEWLEYCINSIEMGGIDPDIIHFERLRKYKSFKGDNWFVDTFLASRPWWKDAYMNHPGFRRLKDSD